MRFKADINRLLMASCISMALACTVHSADDLVEVVVSASRVETDRQREAMAISAVTDTQLRSISHSHITESFFLVPGGWISRHNGQEHLTALRSPVLTGGGSCGAFLMTEDMIPLRASGFCNVNQLFDANSEQAERVEVIRGPGAVIYGSNALHGVINIFTPEANSEPFTSLSLEGGPHDYGRIKVAKNTAVGDHAFAAFANFTSDGGYKDASGFDQQKLTLRYAYTDQGLDIHSGLTVANLNQETAGSIQGDKAYKDNSLRNDNPNPRAYRDAKSVRGWTRVNLQRGDTTYLLTPYFRWNDMEFIQHFIPWEPVEENGHWSLGLQASAHTQLPVGLQLIAGLDMEYTEGWLQEQQAEPFAPHLPEGDHYDYEVQATLLAPFARLTWQMTDSSRIEAGLRFEYNGYDYDNQLTNGSACAPAVTNCRYFRPSDRDDNFDDFSSRLAFFHEIAEGHLAWLSIARGFRAPQASELYRLQNGQAVADLDSEKLDSLELGYRANLRGVALETSIFKMNKRNYIFQDSNRLNISNGKSDHEGVELALRAPLNKQLQFELSGTWARHRYGNNIAIAAGDIENNDIDTAPRTLGRAAMQWRYSGNSTAELEVVHMGKYYLDPLNTSRYDGHRLWSLRVNHQFSTAWKLSARVTNLTDTEYAERADFAFGSERYFVGEPRGVYLGIEGRW